MINLAPDWEALSSLTHSPIAPHDLLGLPADTTDPGLIAQAARQAMLARANAEAG